MVQLLEKIEAGDASHADIDLLESVGTGILGRSLCALGDFAVYPVASFLQKFPTSSAPTSTAEAARSATPPPSRGSSPRRTCTPRIPSRSRCMRSRQGDRRRPRVEVPAGTGLVETAAAAGIEIPVFYEPRLGPPVGACRMCLVEIEGIGKPRAGCTLTAQDGMVVKTADLRARRGAQHSTLEFILVNHPLDCPVCDKGGECPLRTSRSATARARRG